MRKSENLVLRAVDDQGNSFPLIGMVVSWNYNQKRYDINHVLSCAKKYGFDHVFENGQSKMKAVLRALQQAKKEQLLAEVYRTGEKIEYQFTEKTLEELPNGEKYLEYRMTEKVIYDTKTDQVTAGPSQNVIDELIKICSTTFVNNDVTRYTKSIFNDVGMIPMRDQGGMYFIPACYKDVVERVKLMFDEIDPKSSFNIIEVPDLKNSKASVASSFEDSIIKKKKAIKDNLDLITKKGAELSQRKFRGLIEEIATWSKDIEMYADLTEYDLKECKDIQQECTKIVTDYLMNTNSLFKQEDTK